MRASEYIERATFFITDPNKAFEVRQELTSHLTEAAARVEAQGIDSLTAELVAVARMGDPAEVALQLAAAHHRHLPWRHYLAIVPMIVLLGNLLLLGYHAFVSIAPFWLGVLLLCLLPPRSTLVRWYTHLSLDLMAKVRWLQGEPLRPMAWAGLVTGGLGALLLAMGLVFLERGGTTPGVRLFMTSLLPLMVSAGALFLYRPQVPALRAAGLAGGVFALLSLPVYGSLGGPVASGLVLSGFYALSVVGIGWAIDQIAAWVDPSRSGDGRFQHNPR